MDLTYEEAAAQVMEHLCSHSAHGYSQPRRQGVGTGGSVGETVTLSDGTRVGIAAGDRDCSSAAIECYTAVGVDCGGAYYTGDMRSKMCGTGNFEALSASTWRAPRRGDLLLNEGKHVAMALGGGKLGEFLRSERHSTDGQGGDQDGYESVVRALYDDDWDCVLRYCGPEPGGADDVNANVSANVNADANGGFDVATMTTVYKGSTGKAVKVLQSVLDEMYGCDLEVDGVFGAATEECAVLFQQKHGLDADGVVGPKTWAGLLA